MKYSQHILCLAVAFVAANSFAAIDQDIDLRDDCDGGCHPDSVYVDDASNPLGNGDFSNRYDTIAAGIARLGTASTIDSSYDVRTVCVDNGWYPEELLITADQSGTATQYNMVQAEFPVNLPNAVAVLADSSDPDLPVLPSGIATVDDLPAAYIQGGFRLDGSGSADAAEHIAIHGFAITDAVVAGGDGKGQAIRIEGPNSTAGDPVEEFYIIGNYIYHTKGSGVAIWGADFEDNPGNFNNIDGVVVRDNYFHNVLDGEHNEKLHAAVGVNDAWFYKNTFLDDEELDVENGGECIDFKDGVTNSYIVNNDVTRCGWNGDSERRANIYVDGGRTAWNNSQSSFVKPSHTCNQTGPLATCAVYNNNTPLDDSDDTLNWNLDTFAQNNTITIYGNRVSYGTGNAISVATEGFGTNDNIEIYNNTVEYGGAGGIVVHDPSGGEHADRLCSTLAPVPPATQLVCGRTYGVDVYNNTVVGSPSDVTLGSTTLVGKSNQKNYMYNTDHASGVMRANISAQVSAVTGAGHFNESGSSKPVKSDNVCDLSKGTLSTAEVAFCASTEDHDTVMMLDSSLKPDSGSSAVNRTGITVYPATDIDGIVTRPVGLAPDAGAYEQ